LKYWPIPNSHPRSLPTPGERGSFWEDRGDRRHAGIDLYAPPGTPVVAVEDGLVVEVQVFTSPEVRSYWNVTCSILIQNGTGQVCRYAELGEACVQTGQSVTAGQVIGTVGLVLNYDCINDAAPAYIRRLKHASSGSMLHFELHSRQPETGSTYLGGNYFLDRPPEGLLDPSPYLMEAISAPDPFRFPQEVP